MTPSQISKSLNTSGVRLWCRENYVETPNTKYQVGDIVFGTVTRNYYLIEDISYWKSNWDGVTRWVYHYRNLTTGQTGEDPVYNADKARNFYKVT